MGDFFVHLADHRYLKIVGRLDRLMIDSRSTLDRFFSHLFFFFFSHSTSLILFITTSNYTYRTNRCVDFQFTLYEQNIPQVTVPFVPVLSLLVTLVHMDTDTVCSSSFDRQSNNDDHLEWEGRCQGTFLICLSLSPIPDILGDWRYSHYSHDEYRCLPRAG